MQANVTTAWFFHQLCQKIGTTVPPLDLCPDGRQPPPITPKQSLLWSVVLVGNGAYNQLLSVAMKTAPELTFRTLSAAVKTPLNYGGRSRVLPFL